MNTLASNAGRTWLVLPGEVRKRGAALLHQQCWCWGQDIRGEAGNLLLEQGFSRTRPPEGKHGSSTYECAISDSQRVTLWGFGVCWCEKHRGSIFMGRFSLLPRFSPDTQPLQTIWRMEQVKHSENSHGGTTFHPPLCRDSCRCSIDLLCDALNWMADYEDGVLARWGARRRRETLQSWPHAVAAPEIVPSQWRGLSTRCRNETRLFSRAECGKVHISDYANHSD